MIPGKTYRFVLKQGLVGHDVWALQINLNGDGYHLAEDGVFGPGTKAAVQDYQTSKHLTVDGVAGVVTQRSLAVTLITKFEGAGNPPQGLIKGIVEGESGFIVGAVNWSIAGGVDCGWVQRRVTLPGTDSIFHQAFDGALQFSILSTSLRGEHDKFLGMPGAQTNQRAWELATLNHNWPAGALDLAEGKHLSTQPAAWVEAIGVPGVTTPAQWAEYYIDTKTVYVTEWTK